MPLVTAVMARHKDVFFSWRIVAWNIVDVISLKALRTKLLWSVVKPDLGIAH